MRYKPELPPREIDVPCHYRNTSVCRSAALTHDPFVLTSFSSSAASYALEAFDKKEEVTDYIKGEFARLYKDVEVEVAYTFQGSCIIMDVILAANIPEHFTTEVQ